MATATNVWNRTTIVVDWVAHPFSGTTATSHSSTTITLDNNGAIIGINNAGGLVDILCEDDRLKIKGNAGLVFDLTVDLETGEVESGSLWVQTWLTEVDDNGALLIKPTTPPNAGKNPLGYSKMP